MKKQRTENLRVRVAPEEKKVIEAAASKAGHSTSAWLRSIALQAARQAR